MADLIKTPYFPPWMRGFLLLAGVYNLVWGIFIFIFPKNYYLWLGAASSIDSGLATLHALGIVAFGILYITAAVIPGRMRNLIWLGVASKFIGGLLIFALLLDGKLMLPSGLVNRHFLFHIIMNDLIWLPCLIAIALEASKYHRAKSGMANA